MSEMTLEQRVAALERKVTELETSVANGAQKKDWRRAIGMFSGDEVMKQICDEALKYREKDREKARKRYAKSRRKKS